MKLARAAHILPRKAGEGDHPKGGGGGSRLFHVWRKRWDQSHPTDTAEAAAPSTAFGGPPPPFHGGGYARAFFALLCILSAPFAFADIVRAQTLVVGDQKGGSRALMEAAGVLKDVPYTVEWKEFAAAAPLLEALNAGAIDTGIVGDAPFTFAKAAGLKAKAIAAVRQNPRGLAILVRKSSPIKTVDDLEGRAVATGRGSIGHELVLALQQSRGWPRDKPRTVFLSPPDAKVAYGSGSVDAWSTWEPYIAQEEVLFGARTIVTGEGLTAGLSYQAATDAAIAGKRPLLADFLHRLAIARAWSLTHVSSYAATWAKLVGLDAKVSTLWLSRAHITLVPIDDKVIADERKTIELYRTAGLIHTELRPNDMVDTSFAASIAKDPSRTP